MIRYTILISSYIGNSIIVPIFLDKNCPLFFWYDYFNKIENYVDIFEMIYSSQFSSYITRNLWFVDEALMAFSLH